MGRPREFDAEAALSAIMEVFWARGYEGTSLSDLESATGLRKGSLYAAFGDKRAMYLQSLALYDRTAIDATVARMAGPEEAMVRIDRLLTAAIGADTGRRPNPGCFLCNAALDMAASDRDARRMVQASFGRLETALEKCLKDLAAFRNDAAARRVEARHLIAVYTGLRTLARAGTSRRNLEDMKRHALQNLERAR